MSRIRVSKISPANYEAIDLLSCCVTTRLTFAPSASHVETDYSALFDKERPMPVDVSLDSIRYRVGEAVGDDYDDRPSECLVGEMSLSTISVLN